MNWKLAFLVLLAGLAAVVLTTACQRRSANEAAPSSVPATATPQASTAAGSPTATPRATTSAPAGASQGRITVGALTRTFRLFVPAGLPASDVPLVIALHGGLGNPDQFAATTRFDELATAEHFIVIYPAGFESTWNGGACCGRAAAQKVDDVAFLDALIRHLKTQLPVDARKVFVTGHSNGAIMAFRFACERADLVAGIVPVAGSLEVPSCPASRAVPLLAIHGDADQNHPFDGGEGSRSIAGVPFRSMPDTMAMWATAMGCDGAPGKSAAGAITTWQWSPCRDGVKATLLVISGADHPWPGSAPRSSALQGEPTKLLDASKEAWRFFAGVRQ